MAFRYMNPGYSALIDNDCTATDVTGTEYSSTGVGFTQTTSGKGVTLPESIKGSDFWVKFDAYIPEIKSLDIYFYLSYTRRSGVRINKYSDSWYLYQFVSNSGYQIASGNSETDNLIKTEAINNFLLHITLGNPALWEMTINGVIFSNSSRAITYSVSTGTAILYSTSSNVFFSNVIISDTEISPRERILILPISATETDMTAGENGIYIADAANQTLLQKPDISSLIENYGASSQITGIQVVGNPAYKTGTGITTLTGLSKAQGVVTEHDSVNLSEDISAIALDGWTLENTTLADLQNMQFGWKAGE